MDCLDKKVKVKIDKAKEARKSIASLSIEGDSIHIVHRVGNEVLHASFSFLAQCQFVVLHIR